MLIQIDRKRKIKLLNTYIHRSRSRSWLGYAKALGLQTFQVKFYSLFHQLQRIFFRWTGGYDAGQIGTICRVIIFGLFPRDGH